MGKRLQAAGVKRQLTIADLRARPDLRLRWPDFGRTTTLKVGAYCASVNSIPPGQQVYEPLGEMAETLYGSEGWGFESLRARPGQRPLHIIVRAGSRTS